MCNDRSNPCYLVCALQYQSLLSWVYCLQLHAVLKSGVHCFKKLRPSFSDYLRYACKSNCWEPATPVGGASQT